MIIFSSLIGNWEKLSFGLHTNLAVFMFLFMICAIEVVLLKLTTQNSSNWFSDSATADLDDSSEYEEDIYYEELRNNYDRWTRRRIRYRQRQQRLEQELLHQFRLQQSQQQQQQQQHAYTLI